MVVKETSPVKKEADFVAYYREKQAEEDRKQSQQAQERKSMGPSDRPKLKEVKLQIQQECRNTTEPSCDAQTMLDQLVEQMNIELEQVRSKYRPQINHLMQLVHQQQTQAVRQQQPLKKDDKIFRKLKSTSNDTGGGISTKNPPQNLQQVRKTEPDSHEHKKTGTFGMDTFGGLVPTPQSEPFVKSKKPRLLETQTFE